MSTRLSATERLTPEQNEAFRGLLKLPVKQQMRAFLSSFWRDEDIVMKNVFLFANYFALRFDGHHDGICEMELDQAAEMFQKLGQAKPALQLKKELRAYDVDSNGKMCFLEFALLFWNKTIEDLMIRDIDGDPVLLSALRKQEAESRTLKADLAKLQADIAKLEEVAAVGGVKAFSAQQDIRTINEEKIPEVERNLKESEKKVKAAKAKVDAAGSALDKDMQEAGLLDFGAAIHTDLHEQYPKLERNL